MPMPTTLRPTLRAAWTAAFRDAGLRRAVCAAGGALIPTLFGLSAFFAWLESRPGYVLPDPLLDSLGPADVSVPLFTILYTTILVTVVRSLCEPVRVVRGLHAYVILLLLRMAAMALVPLDPPPGFVPLADAFTQRFYPGTEPFEKDLFFSGHTATLWLMALIATTRAGRLWSGFATLAVGVLVIVQHAHYTLDVIAAPLFAWLAWRLSIITMRGCGSGA
ncbi:MAG: phosphatase PAP2-related protein [Gammaproteobacteria bacterium]